jgi:hypothetical protein
MPDSADKRKDILNAADLGQINATIIAGALIFVSISSLHIGNASSGSVTGRLFLITAWIITPFAVSLAILLLKPRLLRVASFSSFVGIGLLISILWWYAYSLQSNPKYQ